MDLTVEPVPQAGKPEFWRLFQIYLREHSAFTGKQPVDGVYEYPWFDDYWRKPGRRWPFWAKLAAGEVVGLALVRLDDDGCFELAEFFVVEEFRRRGVGGQFARALFRRFQGDWKLNQATTNLAAIKFWHHALQEFAPYEEAPLDHGDGIERIERRFTVES